MSRLIWDSDAIDAITMELDMIDRLPFFRVPKWVFDRLTEALNKQPSAESCENPSEIARKSNASGDLINKIVGILIEEGQSDYKKFKLGETIRYTPSEISGILNRHKNELPSAESQVAIKDCRNCKHGEYNDHWGTCFCYNPNDCADWNLWEPDKELSAERTGHWIKEFENKMVTKPYRCTYCNKYSRERSDYCPICGARMVSEDER